MRFDKLTHKIFEEVARDFVQDLEARASILAAATAKVAEKVLMFEKLSPVSTKQRLHNYILRNYTPEARRIVYQRAKPRPIRRGRRFTDHQVDEMRKLHAEGIGPTEIARRYGTSRVYASLIVHGFR